MQFSDKVVVAGTKLRDDGSLLADARIARTGIQLYAGAEVGKPDMLSVRVYRPGSEVFSADTMKSAAHRPVTNEHPMELVSADNWKSVAVGQTGDEITGEGIFIRVPLMVSDGATIKDIESGKRELSAGYTCDLDFTAGKTPSGEAYDAVQKNIRINHVAIVKAGRAGQEVRIGDAASIWGVSPVTTQMADERTSEMNLRNILVDGLQVETTDAGAHAITKLQTDLQSSAANITKLTADHAVALADKDKQLAAKDAELDALKGKVLSDVDLDKKVTARADLIGKAKAVAKDIKTDGLSDTAIRKAAVSAVLGDAAMADKTDAYIDARFDILVEDAQKNKPDAFRSAVQQGVHTQSDGSLQDKAYGSMVSDMENAWKGEAGKAVN